MGKPKFGFTYPTVTGENQITAFRRVLSEFPGMQLWSHYYNGTDLPNWNDVWFAEAPSDCVFLISVKSSDVNALGARLATMPVALRGRVFMFLHHEPDQWRSVSDNRGDPAPDVWIDRQIAFANMRAGASWRDWVQHWVCFTEDRIRTDTAFWEANWGSIIEECSTIDGVAFDCFNIGRSITRVGSDIFGNPVSFARREGRPLIIREYGQVTPIDSPVDSVGVADFVRENWAYAKICNQEDGIFLGIVWYYNHNNTLVDPSGNRPGRSLTKAAIEEIMADAVDVPPTGQDDFDRGYAEGRASRQSEVDDLTKQVWLAEEAIQQLQGDVDNAKAAGRIEAFGEVVNWAEGQS